MLRARRPRWEQGRCAGWIFIWDRHLRLCALFIMRAIDAPYWLHCSVQTVLSLTPADIPAVFWSQVPTLFAYLTKHSTEVGSWPNTLDHNNASIVGETFRGAVAGARTWNKAKTARLSPPRALYCVGYNEGIECFMKSISLQINLV